MGASGEESRLVRELVIFSAETALSNEERAGVIVTVVAVELEADL